MEREYRLWKLIATHRDYLISDDGSVMRLTTSKRNGARCGLILKARQDRDGYLRVGLGRPDAQHRSQQIHRLVASAFIPNPQGHPQVNHVNGRKQDNAIANLEWTTCKQNVEHAHRLGLMHNSKGTANHFAKLSENDVFTIRKLVTHGERRKELASRYGVSPNHISCIVTRKKWAHI